MAWSGVLVSSYLLPLKFDGEKNNKIKLRIFGALLWLHCVTKVAMATHMGPLPFSSILHSIDALKFTVPFNMVGNKLPLKDVAICIVNMCL